VRDGGLISYSANIEERFYRAATFVDKILKGAKPSELPIEQPTRLELIVNAKTAKAQGIEIPSLILAQAHEVIEYPKRTLEPAHAVKTFPTIRFSRSLSG
jgi:putative tryptophan/tyrosine transport system substrate-binding protein